MGLMIVEGIIIKVVTSQKGHKILVFEGNSKQDIPLEPSKVKCGPCICVQRCRIRAAPSVIALADLLKGGARGRGGRLEGHSTVLRKLS